jgi:hypothetical protein
MDSDGEELEPKVKYSFIVYEEDYEEEDSGESSSDSDEEVEGFSEASPKSAGVVPWDPSDIFFRIR